MVASTQEGLHKIVDARYKTAKENKMKINISKTKIMVSTKKGKKKAEIFVEGKVLEQVTKFKYLGAWITEDGRNETEVKSRIAMANAAFNDRKELLTKSLKLKK